MDQSKITVRYAKAFFNLAKEKNLLDTFKKDIALIGDLVRESTDFILLLESPVIKTSQKIKSIRSIFEGKIHELTVTLLVLITENKREIHVPGICRNFLELCRKEQDVRSAVITSAMSLPKKIVAEIKSLLEAELKTRVELSERVNDGLIGGFVLRIDDRQVDASLSTQLRKVKEELLKTEIH